MLKRIAHPTDFSERGTVAFHHALALAVAWRCRLDMLHVKRRGTHEDWERFPHVRDVLAGWGLLQDSASPHDIERVLGVEVAKIEITDHTASEGLSHFIASHRPDLIVLSSHGAEGLAHLMREHVTSSVVRDTHVPALVFGPEARGFLDETNGALRLARALVALAPEPSPAHAFEMVRTLLMSFGVRSEDIEPVTVGGELPELMDLSGGRWPVERLEGPVVETILGEAARRGAGLIAMPTMGPTSGRHGFLETLMGTTTSRILAEAPLPILVVPQIKAP